RTRLAALIYMDPSGSAAVIGTLGHQHGAPVHNDSPAKAGVDGRVGSPDPGGLAPGTLRTGPEYVDLSGCVQVGGLPDEDLPAAHGGRTTEFLGCNGGSC